MDWRWLDQRALRLLHDESISLHGGAPGLRDEGLLYSALARPLHLMNYGAPDHADLAAAYAYGLARNHPFADGNKRTAFLSIGLFLHLNGYRLVAPQAEATAAILSLAAGELEESTLAAWVRARAQPR